VVGVKEKGRFAKHWGEPPLTTETWGGGEGQPEPAIGDVENLFWGGETDLVPAWQDGTSKWETEKFHIQKAGWSARRGNLKRKWGGMEGDTSFSRVTKWG